MSFSVSCATTLRKTVFVRNTRLKHLKASSIPKNFEFTASALNARRYAPWFSVCISWAKIFGLLNAGTLVMAELPCFGELSVLLIFVVFFSITVVVPLLCSRILSALSELSFQVRYYDVHSGGQRFSVVDLLLFVHDSITSCWNLSLSIPKRRTLTFSA